MVKAPEYTPDVALRPAFRQNLEANATPQAFGSDVGTGMDNLAKGGMQAAHAMAAVQALEDETVVRQRRNEFLTAKDKLQYDPDKGYLISSGKTALDGFDQYKRDLDQLRRDHSQDLTPTQQRLFEKTVTPLEIDAQRAGLVHKSKALKAYVVEQGVAGAEGFKGEALANYKDQALWQKYTTAGLSEIHVLGEKLGWSGEKLKREQQDFLSDTHRQTAKQIANDDPIAASEYVTKHRGDMASADYLTAMRELLPQTSEAVTRDAVTTRAGNRSRAQFAAAGLPPEAYQLLGVIAGTEAPGYDYQNGGQRFSNFKDHPRTVGAGGNSTAAGRYQFVKGTWDRVQTTLKLPDFGPASQDVGAWWLAQEDYKTRTGRDLATDVRAGNFAQIKAGLGDTWKGIAKLPDDKFAERMKAAGGKSPSIGPMHSERVEVLLGSLPANYAARLREAADNGVAVAETERATLLKAQRIEVADNYKLRIAKDDLSLTQQEVLDDPVLDKGDKAALINSLKSKQQEIIETQRAITDFQAGKMTVDPYSDDGKKLVDRVWSTIATKIEPERRLATAEEVIRQTGVVPDPLAHAIRNDLVSGQIGSVTRAAGIASRLHAINPAALERRAGGKEILDAAVAFDHLTKTVGLAPAVAAKRLIDMRDPDKARERAALSEHRRDLNREAAEINKELGGTPYDPNLTFPR